MLYSLLSKLSRNSQKRKKNRKRKKNYLFSSSPLLPSSPYPSICPFQNTFALLLHPSFFSLSSFNSQFLHLLPNSLFRPCVSSPLHLFTISIFPHAQTHTAYIHTTTYISKGIPRPCDFDLFQHC